MSERTFTLTFTDAERLGILYALGFFGCKVEGTAREHIHGLEKRLTTAAANESRVEPPRNPVAPAGLGKEAASAILAPPAPASRDHFAHDRKGNVYATAPKDAVLQHVRILQATKSDDAKYLKVIFSGGKANCFDSALWGMIIPSTEVGLWLAKSGNYSNIVGVRA